MLKCYETSKLSRNVKIIMSKLLRNIKLLRNVKPIAKRQNYYEMSKLLWNVKIIVKTSAKRQNYYEMSKLLRNIKPIAKYQNYCKKINRNYWKKNNFGTFINVKDEIIQLNHTEIIITSYEVKNNLLEDYLE